MQRLGECVQKRVDVIYGHLLLLDIVVEHLRKAGERVFSGVFKNARLLGRNSTPERQRPLTTHLFPASCHSAIMETSIPTLVFVGLSTI